MDTRLKNSKVGVSQNDQNVVTLLSKLVAFDTTSRESNLALINYCADYLKIYGIDTTLVKNAEGTKANLWATIGPHVDGGLVLSGHTDCVPVDGQEWSTPPFEVTERGERLYGRGTADMKGFLACALHLVPEFAAMNLTKPVHLAFSYDEEVGVLGVRDLLSYVAEKRVRPGFCVVGEPTSMDVVNGHKGGRLYECVVSGLEAHSSLTPKGVNAIQFGAQVISHIAHVASDLESGGEIDVDFDVPYSTLSTGIVSGGTAGNIIPSECKFIFEMRNLPDADQDEIFGRVEQFAREVLVPQMKRVSDSCNIHFRKIVSYPGHNISPDHPMVSRAMELLGCCTNRKVAFGTEAGLFQQYLKLPTIVCGPGDIGVAHKPDEFVPIPDLIRCVQFLRSMGTTLCQQ
ncbi:acetylornithine deacetylase [Achromobacter marplatensis]|uniref:Acetylornithine deacetylase n=1 Tax=Achromobacter marplatensis TaxID=470868 RepID=A0AA43AZL8_9BURK|nr:acetylornithine deacetylase [Achromobacter marplatensis]MDH2052386.1 acetylornithine deacetylase [Achromobacter marplatensis]